MSIPSGFQILCQMETKRKTSLILLYTIIYFEFLTVLFIFSANASKVRQLVSSGVMASKLVLEKISCVFDPPRVPYICRMYQY